MIEVPPKVWIHKVVNAYIPPDFADNINEGIFDLAQYGKSVYIPKKIGKKTRGPTSSLLMIVNTERTYARIQESVQASPLS